MELKCERIRGPSILCSIKGVQHSVIVDTGAYCSIMNEETRKQLKLPIEKTNNCGIVKMANDSLESPLGWVKVPVTFRDVTLMVQFLVLPSGSKIILGHDFFLSHLATINYRTKQVQLTELGSDLSGNQSNEIPLLALVEGFEEVFAKTQADVGCISDVFHEIKTGDHHPISHRYYRVTHWEKELIDKLLDEMLRGGIVVPSTSPWSSPAVLVSKKDGNTRFCVDYRALNKITLDEPYPIARVEDALDLIEGCTCFSLLDVASMYWHVRMHPDDQMKTAFIVPQGLFEFTRMPFGLKNAPATAARVMNRVLAGLNYLICFIYFDDIIIFGRTREEHDELLKIVLERLKSHGVKLRPHKCRIGENHVDYLGYHIGVSGISPSEDNLKSVRSFKEPKNISELRRFLGLCSYFRRFIKQFSAIAQPLNELLKKNVSWRWTESESTAFQQLKKLITEKPVLACYRTNGSIEVHTDACDYGIGAIMYQQQEDEEWKPVCYISRTLNEHEIKYGITEKECLAIVWAIERLRHYLYGRTFTVITDHCGLCWFMSSRKTNRRLARWALTLQEFSFTVKYKSGKLHGDADCISRNPVGESEAIDYSH